jgi:hypothetical protein
MKLRIVKARTATPGEFRAASEQVPSPPPNMTDVVQQHEGTTVPAVNFKPPVEDALTKAIKERHKGGKQ